MARAVGRVVLAASGAAAGAAAARQERPRSEVIQGEYENRLRRHANPEKVFEYFASVHDHETGEQLMVPEDLVRAIVPYNRVLGGRVGSPNPKFRFAARKELSPPEIVTEYRGLVAALASAESAKDAAGWASRILEMRASGRVDNGTHLLGLRAAGLSQQRFSELLEAAVDGQAGLSPGQAAELHRMRRWSTFAALADADGDGDIDFGEFVTILTLLELGGGSGGPRDADRVSLAFRTFDSDRSGVLEPTEAREMLAALAGASTVGSQVRDRTAAGGELGRMDKARASLLAKIGAEGGRVTVGQLRSFQDAVASALRRAEFDALDVDDSGSLSKGELATLLVSRARPEDAAALVGRSAGMADEAGGGSSVDEMGRLDALLGRVGELELALRAAAHAEGAAGGGVSREGFRRACRAVVGADAVPTAEQEDVLFALFDADGDGRVSSSELCGALRAAGGRDLDRHRGSPVLQALGRLPRCLARAVAGAF